MPVLNRIAFYQNRRDEVPNQELARDLAERRDLAGIKEIIGNINSKNHNVRSDCLKVLYEVAYRKPKLVAPHAKVFLDLLEDKNNRMVWGAMIALGTIAAFNSKPIWDQRARIFKAIDAGSLITFVWGIRTIAGIAAKSTSRIKEVMPKMQKYLRTCKARDVPTHLESMSALFNESNWAAIEKIVASRKKEMTRSHIARLRRALKKIEAEHGGR